MNLHNSICNEQLENLIAKKPFGNENQNGVMPDEKNKTFLSIISHNIKNPFGALLGYSELFLEDYSVLSETERTDFASYIKKTANLTYRYLERFFEWMYYKTDKLKPIFEELNLRNVIGLAIKRSLNENNFLGEIRFNIESDIEIIADSESIVKVFYYILENSIKYNYVDGLIIMNAKKHKEFISIEIIDHGIGMTEEKLNNLFDITVNIANNSTGFENGTGMGLILAKQLLTLNKSSIKIESMQNYGTKVILMIPRQIKYI